MSTRTASGTTPKNVPGEQQASKWVQEMFADIAPRYDLLNHLLSFNIDKRWRKALLAEVAGVLRMPGSRVLDLCCGTGDVILELQRQASGTVIGADFCHPMLVTAKSKIGRARFTSPVVEADALQMPVRDSSLDAITIAFGFRNLANYQAGLRECYRVLKPGGALCILEFSHPQGRLTKLSYDFYSRFLLPVVGRIISGSRDAYSYLPESIEKFPSAETLCQMMAAEGYNASRFRLLSGGIAALHTGRKA